ncbi:MAG: bifunctional 4-hydroxy-2-oxoglutarate aldolase/2-dehydro-3-deoxy-phosphogluconate aldolase [Lachnospiraceae bacterium]|nr:bifunctional 4-hydroxy-2-oxoglutarate aldolase/2-dehydro-3-deoxy-phosphogluconate aldolase [Lachnospiraceae bacterium]
MNEVLTKIGKIGIVPVVALDKAEDALPLGKALMIGGIPCAEVTFRTAAAKEAISIMTSNFPDMLVGAGTVLTCKQVDEAVAAGAKFIVSPGLNPEVVRYCVDKGIPVTPGVATPSEVEQAIGLGLDVVKFFPAEAAGGLPMIKAMSAPYTSMKFMPTGGINKDNIATYLAFSKVLACGGSFMVDKKLIAAGRFDEVTRLSREAVDAVLGFSLAHIGVNCETESEALEDADRFDLLFGFTKKDGNSSVFAGTVAEFMKTPYLGAKGHIAIGTTNVERAVFHLTLRGAKFDEDTAKYDPTGKLKAIYMTDEISGFAVHLVQKG